MTIEVGQKLPQATFHVLTEDRVQPRTTDEVFAGKKVVLFAVPGAFTPTCHKNHLPGYLDNYDAFKSKGVDTIAVTGASGRIELLADGNGDFAKAIGLSLDGSARGMGIRSQRYSMLVDNGVVTRLAVEEAPGKADISGAAALLKDL